MDAKKLLIMVVEDEDLLREAIVKKLISVQMDSCAFAGGQEALEYLKNCQTLPDLIWLDYYLKEMNGMEFVNKLQEDKRLFQIPVVVVSNSASLNKVNALLSKGVKKYLLKAENRLEDIIKIVLQLLNQDKIGVK